MGILRHRNTAALLVSAILHLALLFAMRTTEGPPEEGGRVVELRIEGPKPPEASVNRVASSGGDLSPSRTEVASKGQRAHRRGTDKGRRASIPGAAVSAATDATGGTPSGAETTESSGAVGAEERGLADPPVQGEDLVRPLEFRDFERIFGDVAKKERDAYRKRQHGTRRDRGAFVPKREQVGRAMRTNRSFAVPGAQLTLGKRLPLANEYLREIHRKMSPRFSRFLYSLDSLFEQLHQQVQSGPLKYNPFYVPPPKAARQETLSGPMSDLTLRAMTEFEILRSGQLGEVRLVRTSSSASFDAATVDTIFASAPFTPPPVALISMNQRAYIRWTFYRDRTLNHPSKGHVLMLREDGEPPSPDGGTSDNDDRLRQR